MVAPAAVASAVASVTPKAAATADASVTPMVAPTVASVTPMVAPPPPTVAGPRPKGKAKGKPTRGLRMNREWAGVPASGQSIPMAATQVIVFCHWDLLFTLYVHNSNFAYFICCVCLFLRVLFAYV